MQFFTSVLAATSALTSVAMAGSVQFVNQDNTNRTVYFTQNYGLATITALEIPGLATVNQTFPTGWIGNWYSVSEGADNVPGMLGEVAFDSYAGATYFDVSAIVNPDDNNGVKEIFPLKSNEPVSGCQEFPCDNAYNKPDDIATQSTGDNHLVCLLGTVDDSKRRARSTKFPRSYVQGTVA